MLGKGNLLKIVTGQFYVPKEDRRIFMFLDLRSSTAVAERLGHVQYSLLIQDCFRDLAVVEDFMAEVYQYVGDEAVLVWKIEEGCDLVELHQSFFLLFKTGFTPVLTTTYGLMEICRSSRRG